MDPGALNMALQQRRPEQVIHHGDRIAQMVVQQFERVKWKEVKKVNETKRNEGGFGHTGKS